MARNPSTVAPPLDIRVMNAVSALLLLGLLGMLLAWGLRWVVRQPVFALRAIVVEGDVAHLSAATLRANALPRLAGNFLTLNLREGRAAFEAVPWVRHAELHRVWPGLLRVTLEEHRAVAYWETKADGADADSDASVDEQLVNDHGELFEANLGDVEDQDLPTLAGPAGHAAEMLGMWRELQPRVQRLDDGVERLDLSGRGSWRATFEKGAVVELGRGSAAEVLARFERFARTLTQVTSRYDGAPLVFADLRYPDGYALQLRGVRTNQDKPGNKNR
ncbi:MAG: cell division protein FtsQ/DivIB [Pelomonas sp.]|nr:cell division protein FtsQ/DivIB [Roseateles sp.]